MDEIQDIAILEQNDWLCLPERCEWAVSIPMDATIWQQLPKDLLLVILARLSIRGLAKMRSVCREWNSSQELQRVGSKLSVYSIPGFLVQLKWDMESKATWVIEYLGGNSLDMNIYKAPLPPNLVIVDACKTICCCSHNRKYSLPLFIGNPATRAWRQLPYPRHLRKWDFIGMDVDVSRRRFALFLGDIIIDGERLAENTIVMEIYDSETNAWTRVSMTVPPLFYPRGKGIFSNGKFYWVTHWQCTGHVVAYIIAEKRWTQIRLPERCQSLIKNVELGGCDGHVVLIVDFPAEERIYMWSLKEGQSTAEWTERLEIWWPTGGLRGSIYYPVGANNTGWTVTFDSTNLQISICHPEQRLRRRITLPGLGALRNSPLYRPEIFVSAFDSNNVWWP